MTDRYAVLQELGLTPVWRRRATAPGTMVATAAIVPPAATEVAMTYVADAVTALVPERSARIAALEWSEIPADVAACTACELCKTRQRTVPGVGDARAEWMFVGEAPGAEEDAKGEPFVGQAGKLLDNMLLALGMRRTKQVYIANVLKCRPPNNRAPTAQESDACRHYLDRQIALIRPRIIVALGRSAAATLLSVDATIASLRGRVHRYRGVPLVVTYHPAYLLRTLPDKAKAWEDLCLARATLRALPLDDSLQSAATVAN
ncbi:MAG: uracil-DNA glycosylase [Casimicrobiaceae bacterium]